MTTKFLKIHPADNVYVALTDLKAGEKVVVNGESLTLADDIPAKHKFTEASIQQDGEIFMYGTVVGKATQDIKKGGVIGTHNLKHKAAPFSGRTKSYQWTLLTFQNSKPKHSSGIIARWSGRYRQLLACCAVGLLRKQKCGSDTRCVLWMNWDSGKPDAYKDYVLSSLRIYQSASRLQPHHFSRQKQTVIHAFQKHRRNQISNASGWMRRNSSGFANTLQIDCWIYS
jgi:altronate hydrolase